MDISNRSLVLLLIITVFLVGAAAVLTFGAQLAKTAKDTEPPLAAELKVEPEVHRSGWAGGSIERDGPLTIELEKGVDSVTAMIQCDMYKAERGAFEGGFAFESIPFGNCEVTLAGSNVCAPQDPRDTDAPPPCPSVAYGPVFPGDELTCRVTDGKTTCTGGAAASEAGTVSVKSVLPGYLQVDGETIGPLPIEATKMKVGRREIAVLLNDGRTMRWRLVVHPQETIKVLFPSPDGSAPTTPGPTDPITPPPAPPPLPPG